MQVVRQGKYKTLLVIVTGFLIISAVTFFKGNNALATYILLTTIGIGVLAFTIGPFGNAVVWCWYKLAEVLGWINSRIILSLVFFLLVLPLGFLSRLFKKNPLHLKNNTKTLFEERNHLYKKEDLRNLW